ncbi:acyltransferase family protein [Delftia acidovorans]|uniref:acyltransferase family protein n=1 Tax=Delftia acidovorans TaxID=80866 RepID=UPI002430622B|nr:acyltransferase [Delftia acidovorans]
MSFQNFVELEKKTSSGIYLDNLTGIRALAVLWVLIFHTWEASGGGSLSFSIPIVNINIGLTRLVKMGSWGVDIFFVLSGFLLTIPLLRQKDDQNFGNSLLEFYKRRALRIFPAYYFTLLILIYLLLFGLGNLPKTGEMLLHTLLINPWFDVAPLRGAFWSLPVEALFYVFLPFLILFSKKTKAFYKIFISIVILAILFRYAIFNISTIEDKGKYLFSFFGRMDQFAIGAICAYLSLQKRTTPRKGMWILIAGIIGMITFIAIIDRRGSMFEKRDYFYYFYQSIVAFISALIIFGATTQSKLARGLFGNRAMIFIGTISYSIYLWHTIFLDIFYTGNVSHGIPLDSRLSAAILYTWPPILLASLGTYLFIERPFLGIRHHSKEKPNSFLSKNPVAFLILCATAIIILTAASREIFQINH